MKKKSALIILTLILGLTGCDSASSAEKIPNNEKPLIWWNRQPSDPSTGKLDLEAVHFNDSTYYVGPDTNQGASLQGQMVKDYLVRHGDEMDRNGDGIIGYVLAIGDSGHNSSTTRTIGVRKALGTGIETGNSVIASPITGDTNLNGASKEVKDGSITANGRVYFVRELASREMIDKSGSTWNSAAAKNALSEWASSFGNQIDLIISNNDGMAMSMYESWGKANDVPVFGYDANSDVVAATVNGFCGSICQHTEIQAYMTLRLIRNTLDGVDANIGISVEDDAGNVLSKDDYTYNGDERAFYVSNEIVTEDNYRDFLDTRAVCPSVSHKLSEKTHPRKKVFLSMYNKNDDFLSRTYQPLLQQYASLLNLDITYIGGNGHDESSITDSFNVSKYDAYAINMVRTDNSGEYTSRLSEQ